MGAALALVAAGLVAVLLGGSVLGHRALPTVPYTAVDPHQAAPATSASAAGERSQ